MCAKTTPLLVREFSFSPPDDLAEILTACTINLATQSMAGVALYAYTSS